MKQRLGFLMVAVALSSACGGGGESSSPPTSPATPASATANGSSGTAKVVSLKLRGLPRPAELRCRLDEPAGIGPDIVLAAYRALKEAAPAFFVVGDARLLAEYREVAARGKFPFSAAEIDLIVAGSSLMPSTQEPSHGAGQTRPVNSGKLLVLWSRSSASFQRPR